MAASASSSAWRAWVDLLLDAVGQLTRSASSSRAAGQGGRARRLGAEHVGRGPAELHAGVPAAPELVLEREDAGVGARVVRVGHGVQARQAGGALGAGLGAVGGRRLPAGRAAPAAAPSPPGPGCFGGRWVASCRSPSGAGSLRSSPMLYVRPLVSCMMRAQAFLVDDHARNAPGSAAARRWRPAIPPAARRPSRRRPRRWRRTTSLRWPCACTRLRAATSACMRARAQP